MEIIRCEGLSKIYQAGENKVFALDNVDLTIEQGSFTAITGPSGSGKSTLLHLLSGLDTPSKGRVIYQGKNLYDYKDNQLSVLRRRRFGFVFQSYNLVRELTGWENILLPVMLDGRKADEAYLDQIVDMLGIRDRLSHLPGAMSGGQQQRVALARAIVIHPQVLLMDEPLSNLDAKLRVEMRNAIKLIQQKIGITTVYVTHDQEEALAVSDRIAIMNNGIIQQIGTPKEIYQRPNCVFVATFIGLSNILEAKVKITGAAKILDFGAYEVPMDNLIPEISAGSKVLVSVRPEEFEICLKGSDGLTAVVEHSVFLGVTTHYFMRLENGQEIEVVQNSGVEDTIPNKTTVRLLVQPAKINVFTEDGNTPLIVRGNR